MISLCDTPAERPQLIALSKDVKPVLLRKAYLAANQASGQLLWLPPRAQIATHKPRPQYVGAPSGFSWRHSVSSAFPLLLSPGNTPRVVSS